MWVFGNFAIFARILNQKMRRIYIEIVCRLLIAIAVAMLIVSCRDVGMGVEPAHKDLEPQLVGFYAGGAQTRTEMLDNGLSTVWVADDQIALWARGSSGSYALSNQVFKTYGLDSQRGFFTTELASAMADDTYTYYCCYPVPSSVNETKANLYVPTVQDGKVIGGADIMVATPVQHGALARVPEPEDHSGMSMTMNRMMHQFRFFIGTGGEKLQGAGITKMVLTFPTAVVGNVQVDYTDPNVNPVLTSGYRSITMNLKDELTLEKDNYACVAFVPSEFKSGDSLQVKAYTSDKIVQLDPIDLKARNFQKGHSTPVKIIIKDVIDYPYKMTFKLAGNNLGENVNSITLTAPKGCSWTENGSEVYTYTTGKEIMTGEEIVFRFEDKAQYRAFSGKSISVTYDSENAITYQAVTVPDLSSSNSASVSLTVPYLFYEDFSAIPSFNDGHDSSTVGAKSDTWVGITDVSDHTSALDGWYAARIGGQAGKAVRICCRYEDVLGTSAYYKGRLYTPTLSRIKDDKLVKISVSFKYSGNRDEMKTIINWQYKAPDKSPVLYYGIYYNEEITNPDEMSGDFIDSVTGLITGAGFRMNKPASLSQMNADGFYLSKTGGSYTSFTGTKTVTYENIDNGMRLAWILSTDNTQGSVNANYWFYIDDIKVQIAK